MPISISSHHEFFIFGKARKGGHPLRRESGYPLNAKGVTAFVTPFAYFIVLRTTPGLPVLFAQGVVFQT